MVKKFKFEIENITMRKRYGLQGCLLWQKANAMQHKRLVDA